MSEEYQTDMKNMWKLHFNNAIKTMTIEEAQDRAWEELGRAWNTRPQPNVGEIQKSIIIQREVKRKDVLPKGSVDVLSLKCCERIAQALLKPSKEV